MHNSLNQVKFMNIKLIVAVVVLTIVVLLFSSSFGGTQQPVTTTTTTTSTTTSPQQTTAQSEDISAAVSVPEETPEISAPQAGLYNLSTGKVLYEKNGDTKISPASLAKILTAVTALTYMDSDTVITVGSELDLVPKHSSICLIQKGHKLTLYDLLTGMLIASGNDAARTVAVNVARHVSDSDELSDKEAVSYFVKLMNGIAQKIGCTDSKFKTPDGFDAKGQHTTVQDLALLYAYAINFTEIREITSHAQKKVVFASGENITWTNTNKLLHSSSPYYFPAATGMKTGTTNLAGNCLVASVEIDGQLYLSVVTGCSDEDQRYKATLELFDLINSK